MDFENFRAFSEIFVAGRILHQFQGQDQGQGQDHQLPQRAALPPFLVLALTLVLVLTLALALAPSGMMSKKEAPYFCPSTEIPVVVLGR